MARALTVEELQHTTLSGKHLRLGRATHCASKWWMLGSGKVATVWVYYSPANQRYERVATVWAHYAPWAVVNDPSVPQSQQRSASVCMGRG
jgi:hypothetical protein